MVTIKPAYFDYTKWMWRVYALHQQGGLSVSTPLNLATVDICDHIYSGLSEREQDIITDFAVKDGRGFDIVNAYAAKHDLSPYYVWNRIKHIMCKTAEKRGIWESRTDQKAEDTSGKA